MPLRLTLKPGVCGGWATVSHNHSCYAVYQVFTLSFIHSFHLYGFVYLLIAWKSFERVDRKISSITCLQVRILEWAGFPFSRGLSQPRNRTQVSHITGRFFTIWATRKPTLEVTLSFKKLHYLELQYPIWNAGKTMPSPSWQGQFYLSELSHL